MALKARDLRVSIKDMGFEQAVVHALEIVLEQQAETRRNIHTLTELVDGCIKQIELMVKIGSGMKDIIQDLRRITEQGEANDQKGQE
jgi:hypothetical protein